MASKLATPVAGTCAGHPCDACATCRRGRCCRRDNPGYQLPSPGEWEGRVFGQFGVLDVDEIRVVCHACGGEYASLIGHIGKAHDLTADEYRAIFALPTTTGLVNGAMSRLRREQVAAKFGEAANRHVPLTREQVDEAQRRWNARERAAAAFMSTVGAPVSPRNRKRLDPCIVCERPVPASIRRRGRRTCSDACKAAALARKDRALGNLRRKAAE